MKCRFINPKQQHFSWMGLTQLALACSLSLSSPVWARIDSGTETIYSYEVNQSDTANSLAKKLLAEPARWAELMRLNKAKNANDFRAGTIIDVPSSMRNQSYFPEMNLPSQLSSVWGQVSIDGKPVQAGAAVPVGARVQTGVGSSATVRLADGSSIQLMPRSIAQVVKQGSYAMRDASSSQSTTWYSGAVRLFEGAMEVLANKTAKRAEPLGIFTPTSVIGVRGTNFRVVYEDPSTQVARTEVLSGLVNSANASNAAQSQVPAGFGTAFKPSDTQVKTYPLLPALPRNALPEVALRQGQNPAVWNLQAIAGASGYKVDIAKDEQFVQIIEQIKSNSPAIALGDLPNGSYYMRVRGYDAQGIEGYNAVGAIAVTQAPPPVVPQPVWAESIHQGATVQALPDGRMRLLLANVPTELVSRLQVVTATDPQFTQAVQSQGLDGQQSVLLPAIAAGQRRYIKFTDGSQANSAQSTIAVIEAPVNWGSTVFGVMHPLQMTR